MSLIFARLAGQEWRPFQLFWNKDSQPANSLDSQPETGPGRLPYVRARAIYPSVSGPVFSDRRKNLTSLEAVSLVIPLHERDKSLFAEDVL